MIRRPPRSTLFPTRRSSDLSRLAPAGSRHSRQVPRDFLRSAKHRGALFGALEFRHGARGDQDRKSTRLNSSHGYISYAVFCLKKKKMIIRDYQVTTA